MMRRHTRRALVTGVQTCALLISLAESGATRVAVESNPIDAVWADRPQPSDAKLTVQPDVAAGKSSAQTRQEIADWLAAKKADAVVLPALDSIARALHVRGGGEAHPPVPLWIGLASGREQGVH